MSVAKIGMTIEEAAEMSGIGRNTMRALVDWGKLPVLKVGRKTCSPSMIPLMPSSGRALQGKAGRSLGASALRENVSRQGN